MCVRFINTIVSFFFFSSRRRHTRYWRDWSSDVCSSDLPCHVCGTPIAQVDFEEHTIYYCPKCQTGGRVLKDRRSEEHTSELQSRQYLVCRLLLEKKKKQTTYS